MVQASFYYFPNLKIKKDQTWRLIFLKSPLLLLERALLSYYLNKELLV